MAKAIVLISGGIDSAVAAGLALREGMELVALHYSTVPFADERAEEKTRMVLRHLAKKFGVRIKLIVVPHGRALKEIAEKCERRLNCVLCRRMMLRVASKIAESEKAGCLLSGESMGQVASQTLSNLNAEAMPLSVPVVRPLLGMDKIEIERIAKEFGTFELSILPAACCSIPEKPATKAAREEAEAEEKKIGVPGIAENAGAEARVSWIEA